MYKLLSLQHIAYSVDLVSGKFGPLFHLQRLKIIPTRVVQPDQLDDVLDLFRVHQGIMELESAKRWNLPVCLGFHQGITKLESAKRWDLPVCLGCEVGRYAAG